MGHRSGRAALDLPTPRLVETGSCAVVTATHRRLTTVLTGTQGRPSHIRGGMFMLSHRTLMHSTRYARVYTLTNAHRHTSPGTCHHCEHHPKGTDFHVQSQKYSCSDTHVGSPGPFRHCHRWPLAAQAPPPNPAQAPPTHQVLGRLSQHGKGGQVLALAAGVGCLGLQGLTALSVPVP